MDIFRVTSQLVDGNMDFRFGPDKNILHNREKFLGNLGLSLDNLVCMRVDHGSVVREVTSSDKNSGSKKNDGIQADALITDEEDLILGLLTADCIPIFVSDTFTGYMGLIHAGWQSAHEGIISHTLDLLCSKGVKLKNLKVHLGPHIQTNSYQKPPSPTQLNHPKWQAFLSPVDDVNYLIDLTGFCMENLIQNGIPKANINIDLTNTYTHPNYFSHRQAMFEGLPEGRMLSLIGRVKPAKQTI